MGLRRREELQAREGIDRGRRSKEWAGSIVYTLVVVVSAMVLIALSANVRRRWDVSEAGQNGLSPQTQAVLDRLDDEVRVKAFYTARHSQRATVANLLEMYERGSPMVRAEIIDPVARPAAVRDLGLEVSDQTKERNAFFVVSKGTQRLVFRGATEEALTNALLEVGAGHKKVLGFIRGYDESDPASSAGAGMSMAAEALRQEYYDVRDVFLSQPIAEDVTSLVLAGAHRPMESADLDRLAAWLATGGRLLVLQEPGAGTGVERVLEPYGLRLPGERLIDPQENLNGRVDFLRITQFTKHPVVERFGAHLPAILPTPGTVDHFEPVDATVFHDGPMKTSRFAVGVAEDGSRQQGPFLVGACSWKRLRGEGGGPEREIRIFVVGDADFALNAYLPLSANRNLFLNAVAWLSRSEGLVTIRRSPLEGQNVDLRPSDNLVLWLALLAGPMTVLGVGIAVWFRRRGL